MKAKLKKKLIAVVSLFSMSFQVLSPAVLFAVDELVVTEEPVVVEQPAVEEVLVETSEDLVETITQDEVIVIEPELELAEEETVVEEPTTDEPQLLTSVIEPTEVEEVAETEEVSVNEVFNLDNETPVYDSSASVSTDQADYSPDATVLITANNLLPNQEYLLIVRSNDPPGVNFEVNLTTNDQGSFTYSYQLDGNYRPDYLVEVFLGDVLVTSTTFTDSHIVSHLCQVDTAGADDQPNQKDLTQMCVDYTNLSTSLEVDWNWDDTSFPGANTGDACSLYDTDGDGFANYAVCVGVSGTPTAEWSYTKVYSCGDTRADRCTSTSTEITPTAGTTCTASVQTSVDPFDGSDDTVAECTVYLDDVGGGDAASLIDVCSYPSGQPNSAPSDCIVFRDRSGKLEIVKNLVPSDDTGLFNLQIDGATIASNVGDGGTTGEQILTTGNNGTTYSVGETAGTDTSLSNYSTSIECLDLNGTGTVVASGSDSGPLNVLLETEDDVVCTITNTLDTGSITVLKNVDGNNDGDLNDDVDTTGATDWTWDVDASGDYPTGSTQEFQSGEYIVTEDEQSGYHLVGWTCDNDASGSTNSIPLVLGSGEDVTCTFTNAADTGSLTLVKSDANGVDPLDWTFDVSGPNNYTQNDVESGATLTNLVLGTYNITESGPDNYHFVSGEGCSFGDGTATVEVTTNGVTFTCTFTNAPDSGSVAGTKYHDKNANGQFDGEDETLSGWTIRLYQNNEVIDSVLTDGSGNYSFSDLVPGDYEVCEVLQGGWTQIAPIADDDCHLVTISPGEDEANLDFFNFQNVTISGYKFEDMNGNGVWDNGEPALDGWTINLGGDASDSVVTGSGDWETGYYEFIDLGPGTYTLDETVLPNWFQTAGDFLYEVTVVGGEDVTDLNFGNFEFATVWGYKYNDLDADGDITDSVELLDGWTISLTGESDVVTGDGIWTDGYYEFTGLTAGIYDISESEQLGWTQSFITDEDGQFTIQSGDIIQIDFGNWTQGTLVACKYDENQEPVGDWDMTVTGGNLDDGITQSTVRNGGCTTFDLDPGTYTVTEEDKAGWIHTDPVSGEISGIVVTSNNQSDPVNFYNERMADLTILKFNDVNGNQVNDDETYLSGWHFDIYEGTCDAIGELVGSGASDTVTPLSFELPAGDYCVVETEQAGWTNTTGLEVDVALLPNEDETIEFGNQARGSITVYKNVDTDNDGDVDVFGSIDWSFELDSDVYIMGTSVPVAAGSYSLSEIQEDDYHFVSLFCDEADQNSSTTTVEVAAGDSVVCTYTNSRDTASVNGHKYEDVNGNGQVPEEGENGLAGWTIELYQNDQLIDSISTNADGYYEFINIPTGSYTICEVLQAGWVQTYPDGCHVIELGLDSVSRDFGNQGIGTVTVNKDIDTDGDGNVDTSNTGGWTYDLDGSGDYRMGSTQDVVAGTYTLTEDDQDGYHFVSLVCYDGVNQNSNTTDLEVAPGQDVVCTYTNARDIGSILVTKIIDADGNLETTEDQFPGEGWEMEVDGQEGDTSNPDSQNTDANGETTFTNLKTGLYTVFETLQPGYDMLNAYCDEENGSWDDAIFSVEVEAGDEANCTFINAPNGSIQGFKWNDVNNNGEHDGQREALLGGWRIFVDENQNQTWDEGEQFQFTDDGANLGTYEFTNLFPGTYTICEELLDGWVQTYPNTCHTVELPNDGESTYNFGNVELGEVVVIKYEDRNGNGEMDQREEVMGGWTMNLEEDDYSESGVTDGDGQTIFEDLIPGRYILSEEQQEHWLLTNISCGEDEQGGGIRGEQDIELLALEPGEAQVEVGGGETVTCYVGNQGRGTIEVRKDVVPDDDGASQWQIGVSGETFVMGDNGTTGSIDIAIGGIEIRERGFEGTDHDLYTSTYSCVTNDENQEEVFEGEGRNFIYRLGLGESAVCTFVNTLVDPELNISKTVNTPTTSRGGNVTYTILVRLFDSNLSDVTVTDLLPDGFTYRSGSWTAESNVRGDLKGLGVTTEPTYASPGVWQLGDMEADEMVTLSYIADVANDVEDGTYPDLAWAQGITAVNEQLLALAVDPGFVDTNFVGTKVTLSSNQELSTNFGGQVLGASTELPATGASAVWLWVAGSLMTMGIGLSIYGLRRRKYEA